MDAGFYKRETAIVPNPAPESQDMPDENNTADSGLDGDTVADMIAATDHLAGSADERQAVIEWAGDNLDEQEVTRFNAQLRDPQRSARAFAELAARKREADRRGDSSFIARQSKAAGGYASKEEALRGRRELSPDEHMAKLRKTDTSVLGRPPQPSRRRV